MAKVYASKIRLQKSSEEISSMMEKVPEWRRQFARRFRMTEDTVRCLAAYLLAARVIADSFGCLSGDVKMTHSEFGKPEILFPEGCHFNISHSGEWVVCAVDSSPVGIDVESIKPMDIELARRFFTSREYRYILDQPPENRLSTFLETWSFKECYLKAQGTGLHRSLNSFCVLRSGGEVTVEDTQAAVLNLKLRSFFIDEGYVMAVAAANISDTAEILPEEYFC